jgi:hypothetical protein
MINHRLFIVKNLAPIPTFPARENSFSDIPAGDGVSATSCFTEGYTPPYLLLN